MKCFEFFISNKLISQKQSGFKPGDSSKNQFLAITHEIYKSSDVCLGVRTMFLCIKNIEQILAPGSSLKVEAKQYFG